MNRIRAFVRWLIAEYIYRQRKDILQAQRGVLILLYHEIIDKKDARFRLFPLLCTTPATFRWQIEWLRKHFEIISMDEAEERLRNGSAADSRA
ncbi:MAG: hypothetical protein RMM08_12600, partial [Armatimonadota bacterium]|nr:hypothetical protein [Armatimonadota bacterium]